MQSLNIDLHRQSEQLSGADPGIFVRGGGGVQPSEKFWKAKKKKKKKKKKSGGGGASVSTLR